MIVEVCVGSSCHIKGSQDIVELMQGAIEKNHLDDDVILIGSFCTGKCNREGVTVIVDDEIYTGITRDSFKDFFEEKIATPIKRGK